MKEHIPESLSTTPVKIGLLALLSLLLVFITWFCLTMNIQILFTHLYYIPIIVAAFWFRRAGVVYAVGLAVVYLGMVLSLGTPGTQDIIAAVGRAVVFIGISGVVAVLSIILQHKQEEISLSETKFRGIWENIQAAIILIDPETHTILAANPEARKLTGFSEEEMTGHACQEHICPAAKGKCPISDLGMTLARTERVLLARDGKKVPVFKTVTDMTINGKRCFIESYIDITQVKEAENTLLAYLREATLRTRNPVELVRDNLKEIRDGIKGQTTTPDNVVTALIIQEKHMDDILKNLQELERAVVEKRPEIPDALRDYLKR